jgi:hypothetical protein
MQIKIWSILLKDQFELIKIPGIDYNSSKKRSMGIGFSANKIAYGGSNQQSATSYHLPTTNYPLSASSKSPTTHTAPHDRLEQYYRYRMARGNCLRTPGRRKSYYW